MPHGQKFAPMASRKLNKPPAGLDHTVRGFVLPYILVTETKARLANFCRALPHGQKFAPMVSGKLNKPPAGLDLTVRGFVLPPI